MTGTLRRVYDSGRAAGGEPPNPVKGRREMEYRTLGKDGVKVSAVAFGAWAIGGWLWGGTDARAAADAIRTALDLGITTIDTAPAYGFGLSERIVGEAVRGRRDRCQILTKFGLRWDLPRGEFYFNTADADGRPVKMFKYAGRESVKVECERSLARLGTDYIDLLQIHWPDPTTPIRETMGAVLELIVGDPWMEGPRKWWKPP